MALSVNNLPTRAGDGSDVGLIPGSGRYQFIHSFYVNKFYTHECFSLYTEYIGGLQRKLSAEEWMLLNCGVGEDLRVPWTARKSNQSVHTKGNQFWVFIRKSDVEGETPIFWPPDAKG